MNEKEMRDADVPRPDTAEELTAYIESLVDQDHDYGTCVYAMSMAATAAFYYVAHRLGASGFQASFADMDVLRRTRRFKGPFMLIDANDMLYPQYLIEGKVREALNEWQPWAKEQAEKLLAENHEHASANVIRHWRQLAGQTK